MRQAFLLPSRAFRTRAGTRDERGMTLVELLVAATISVLLTAMILLSWFALSRSYASTVKREKATDITRLALARMEREIRDAEQPPANVSEVAVVYARPFSILLYTTFNLAGAETANTKPRLVLYRLYGDGELWRFQDLDGDRDIDDVNEAEESWPVIIFDVGERAVGEGGQLMASNVVNASTPQTSPTALAASPIFTYIYYSADGVLQRSEDVRGTENRAQIRAVEINLLIDMNPGKSPVYTHLRTTAQLRNTR